MKVYVATKWEARDRARDVMSQLEAAGHTITYDWTPANEFSPAQALVDWRGVRAADVLVFLAEHALPFKGAYVEFGMAAEREIPILVIGRGIDACIFTQLPTVRLFGTLDDAVLYLNRMTQEYACPHSS